MTKPVFSILGAMTGTSCDGLDVACIKINRESWEPDWAASRPYPKSLRARVLSAQKPGTRLSFKDWLALERDLGEWYGDAFRSILRNGGKVDLIANHGQTIAHFPAANRQGMTLQLGDPARIARATGITVVSKFRDGDMAAGGEGAPLAPGFHAMLAACLGDASPSRGIAIHNIGGISNFTYLGKKIIAFDTGPGNAWIDAATERATHGRLKFDKDGKLARKGEVDLKAADKILRLPYFSKSPPKSTGRDDFPFELLLANTRAKGVDLIATATWITVETIAYSYEKFILRKKLPLTAIHIVGGGAKNPAIMTGLKNFLSPIPVTPLEAAGIDPQLIEAQAFAYFGFLSLLGIPLGGEWTGAQGFAPPAHIIPGENWASVLKKLERI